jgi:hypothetical protein
MAIPWKTKTFEKTFCSGEMVNEGNGDILVNGIVNGGRNSSKVVFWASAPPNRGTSFYGSGHPFPNPEVAYDNTPNRGTVNSNGTGKFSFRIQYPNAYYIGLGTLYVPPHLHIKVCDSNEENCSEYFTLQIDDGIPFRTLTHPSPPSKKPRSCPGFYYEPEREVRSQDTILHQSAYPSTHITPDNFWGDKPPK